MRTASIGLATLLLVDALIVALVGPDLIAAEEMGLVVVVFLLCAGLALWILLRRGVIAYLSSALFGAAAAGLLALFVVGGHYFSEISSPGTSRIPDSFVPILLLQVAIAVVATILLILSPGVGRAAVD